MIEVLCEYTDTFGGDANYSWVRRATLKLPAGVKDRALMKAAKTALNLVGVRGKWDNFCGGDHLTFRPYGMCTVLIVTVLY